MVAAITLSTGRSFDVGPRSIAWHGLFTALGIVVATALALRFVRERDLDRDRLINLVNLVEIAGIVGARKSGDAA